MNKYTQYFVNLERRSKLLQAKDEAAELIEHLNERQLNEIAKQAYNMMNYQQQREYNRHRGHYGL